MFLRKVAASEITVLGFAVCTSDATGQAFWESSLLYVFLCIIFFPNRCESHIQNNTVKNE